MSDRLTEIKARVTSAEEAVRIATSQLCQHKGDYWVSYMIGKLVALQLELDSAKAALERASER